MRHIYKVHQRKIVIIGIALFVLHRVWLAVKNSIPVGWDGGMYKDYLQAHQSFLPSIEITQIPDYILGGFPPFLGIIGSVTSLFGISANMVVTLGPTLLVLMIGLASYSLLRTWGDHRAIIGGLLVTFSPVLFWLAWSGFLKQLVATLFLITVCKFLIHRKYLLSCIVLIALLFTHRPSGLFAVFVLLIFAVIQIRRRTALATWLVIVWSGVISFLMYLPIIGKLVPRFFTDGKGKLFFNETGGTFFMRQDFLMLQTPLIILVVSGVIIWLYERFQAKKGEVVHNKKTWDDQRIRGAKLIWIGWVVAVAWFVLGFTFHNRMQPFLELMSILLACITVIPACIRHAKGRIIAVIILVFHISLGAFIAHSNSDPRIAPNEIERIQTYLDDLPKNAYIMNVDSTYTTWLMGYTDHSRNIIGPYVTDHWRDWDIPTWQVWGSVDGYEKCDMIQYKYADGYSPLYVFVGARTPYDLDFDGAYCLTKMYDQNFTTLYQVSFE